MYIVENYGLAIVLCVITMLCWGSWANTTKLTAKTWRFELLYWDYGFGILITTLLLAFTLGSYGNEGRSFVNDIGQAANSNYHKLQTSSTSGISKKGLILSVVSGSLMGLFYKYVAGSMVTNFNVPEAGKLTPYTALVIFAVGIVISSFVFNTIQMKRPFSGTPVSFNDYFKGLKKDHLIGILGGMIWCIGMSLSIIASGKAGPAVSYGLGQGATVVAALWGIYVWKEFEKASKATKVLLNIMLLLYIAGLTMIIISK